VIDFALTVHRGLSGFRSEPFGPPQKDDIAVGLFRCQPGACTSRIVDTKSPRGVSLQARLLQNNRAMTSDDRRLIQHRVVPNEPSLENRLTSQRPHLHPLLPIKTPANVGVTAGPEAIEITSRIEERVLSSKARSRSVDSQPMDSLQIARAYARVSCRKHSAMLAPPVAKAGDAAIPALKV
jgi:hypothetical protein